MESTGSELVQLSAALPGFHCHSLKRNSADEERERGLNRTSKSPSPKEASLRNPKIVQSLANRLTNVDRSAQTVFSSILFGLNSLANAGWWNASTLSLAFKLTLLQTPCTFRQRPGHRISRPRTLPKPCPIDSNRTDVFGCSKVWRSLSAS